MMTLNDDQRMLHDTVAPFMADEGAIAKQLRHWRDTGCKDGFGHGLWKQLAELGLTGILIPEAHGGAGLGQVEANVVLEEIGRNLTPSPFLTTAVAAVRALQDTAQAERWFPGIVAGETVAALAIDEGKRHDPAGTTLAATRQGNGFSLSGTKQFVVHGGSADVILVAARTAGSAGENDGITLFAVPEDASGLTIDNVDADRRQQGGAPDVGQCVARCRRGGRRGRWRLVAAFPRPQRGTHRGGIGIDRGRRRVPPK